MTATTTPWPPVLPCHICGGRGRRNLGVHGYCAAHLGELYATFSTNAWMDDADHDEALLAAAHDRLLETPDNRTDAALAAWGDRLERAVLVGIVTRAEADRAWRRAVRDVAA